MGISLMETCSTLSPRCGTRWYWSCRYRRSARPIAQGLCSTCGIRLADAEPDHGHASDGGVWAVLKGLFPDGAAEAE